MSFKNNRVTLIIAFLILGAVVAFLIVDLGTYKENDILEYETLILGEKNTESGLQVSNQHRKGLRKDVFFQVDGQRRHMQLNSASAELVVENYAGHIGVIEKLKDMSCYIQEAFINSPVEQIILFLKAENVNYLYEKETFIADDVEVLRYLIPGHDLEIHQAHQQILMRGFAKHVTLLLSGNGPNFQADEMRWIPYNASQEELITVTADHANYTVEKIILNGHVHVLFANGSTLTCDNAVSRFNDDKTITGYFFGGETQEYVVYKDTENTIQSRRLNIQFTSDHLSQQDRSFIQKMHADGDVSVEFQDEMILNADQMTYVAPWYITMTPYKPEGRCFIYKKTGEVVETSQIDVDTLQKQITLPSQSGLTYKNPMTGRAYTLKCQGPVHINYEKMEISLFGTEKKQIHLHDDQGDIYADYVQLLYLHQDHVPVLTKMILLGHVKISNCISSKTELVCQYILADKLEFFPDTNEMILKAKKGQRVLFFDQLNMIEVSAPTLKIIRGKALKMESIQGIGNVRLQFIEKELEHLRRKFSLTIPQTDKYGK